MDLYANGFWAIVGHNWYWILAAFLIGAYIGWKTCDPVSDGNA